MTYDSLVNHGDYLSAHYLAEMLPKRLKAKDGLLARWSATEDEERRRHKAAVEEARRAGLDASTVPPRSRTPREGLRALHGVYFASRADFAREAAALMEPGAPVPADWSKRLIELHLETLRALGYAEAHERTVTVHRAGHEYRVEAAHAESGVVALCCGWTAEPDAALDPDGAGRLLHPVALETTRSLVDAKAATDFLFECDDPPRYVLLLAGGVIVLADRLSWHEGRYLAVDLDAALNRRDDRSGGELDTVAALFGADSLRVPEGGGAPPLADFVEQSGKHAVGVSAELREGLRLSVEWVAEEVLTRLREQGVSPEQLDQPERLAKRLTRESLRYLYRILFLLYAEAQPTLGIVPVDHEEYERGYGLQRLGDLVVRDLVGERSRQGFHLYESLDLLFRKVERGHREYGTEPGDTAADEARRAAAEAEHEATELLNAGAISQAEHDERIREADRSRRAAARSEGSGLRFEPLRSELFREDAVCLISNDQIENPAYDAASDAGSGEGAAADGPSRYLDTRLRNETLHKVLRRLMLSRGKGRERGGFISYAQLGINQLGAVYEGLMSYTGFIAEEDLYEVAKGGEPADGSWMIPAQRAEHYPDEVFVRRVDEGTGREERVVHPKGSFVYRLAGRDRQTSASYYTPKSLTEVTVELTLKHRLDQDGTTTPARELLDWKICEPALGSGAFLNEAIDQVAAEYLRRREREVDRRIDPEWRQVELQKAKAYIALHNAYGVDLNATAVELAEISLWLNSMHTGMRAPWFGLHLLRGNSLIGAGRRIYAADDLSRGGWLRTKNPQSPTEHPFRDGELPQGAVHHFLLPATGWGAVAGDSEARKLAPEDARALNSWRKGIRRAPKRKTQVRRLQGIARRVEFLWKLVAMRLEASERKVARRIEVWGADWLDHPDEAVDRPQILHDLTAVGTPYRRLKTVMDTWCALWFWPLDKVGELDGTAPIYESGGGVVSEADVAAFLTEGQLPSTAAAEPAPAAPESRPTEPAPGDLDWQSNGLFDDPDGEQQAFQADLASGLKTAPKSQSHGRTHNIKDNRRPTVPLRNLDDWLEFLESVLGRQDVREDSFLNGIEELPPGEALERLSAFEKNLESDMGMDSPVRLPHRFPWFNTVEDLAGTTEREVRTEEGHGFFHWELRFAHIFRRPAGGFDVQVGNPPWVRPRWEENALLAEHEPWFMLTEKPTHAEKSSRRDALLAKESVRRTLLTELAAHSGTTAMLGGGELYPLLASTQPDLYRAFMCRSWGHMADHGTVGMIHPDSHFSGDKEALLREAAYSRLRVHGDFVNAGNRFFPPPVGRSSHFGVHIYGPRGDIGFDHLSWLFSVDALRLSAQDDGTAPDPGVRYGKSWDERPHRKRIVRVDEATLAQWQYLTGDEEQPARQGRLLSPVSTAEAQAIEALANYPTRLAEHEPQISSGYHESGAKAAKIIDYNVPDATGDVRAPADWSEVILKGPQIGLANPMFKQPSQGAGEMRGLNPLTLADDAVPESEYVYVADKTLRRAAQDLWDDGRSLEQLKASKYEVRNAWSAVAKERGVTPEEVSDAEVDAQLVHRLRRPYTEFYRMAWREFIAPDTERSLYVSLIPCEVAHVDLVHSAGMGSNVLTVLTAGFWAGMPVDYLLRTTGIRHLKKAPARRMPAPEVEHPLASALLLRTLRLNCLTDAYADLWNELYDQKWSSCESWACDWPGTQPLQTVTSEWNRDTPLRNEQARRAALVEIDALVAVWLGVSADSLVAMYRSRFPIMQDFDAVTWFDANGRKIAGDRYTYGFGQTKEDYKQLLAYQEGERTDPPEGYTPPFYKADREREMRAAHAHFEKRLHEA